MKKHLLSSICLFTFSGFLTSAQAQEVTPREKELFGPFKHQTSSPHRSPSGKPAPSYWQNSADYHLAAELDDENHRIEGTVTITYTNNSPEELEFLWLQLEQNKFHIDSRGMKTSPFGGRFRGDTTKGYTISDLMVNGDKADYLIDDTRMKVNLEEPLEGEGNDLTIKMDFEYEIPTYGADRMGRLKVEDGWIYELAQWYPRVCVFDDIRGWNVRPYLGTGEFYLEYGNYELELTVPYDHIVAASGALQNPGDVLTSAQQKRYEQAQKSKETLPIIKPKEAGDPEKTRPVQEGKLTWEFELENAHDVAWASSPSFIWDGSHAEMPSGRDVFAMSFYPKESNGDSAWGRSTEYTRESIEHYSAKWYEYPYPTAVNVAGIVGGMEYPGLSFCHWQATDRGLWGVTDHEFGHNWFPMIVGSNERLYAWMDEGMNSFINYYSTKDFNDGEYQPRLDDIPRIIPELTDENREKIATYPDVIQSENLGLSAYGKPALGLYLLREVVLGPERFDPAFKTYIKRWAYKHPAPADFFNTMENVAGEELNWFWKGWIYSNRNLDQSVRDVSYVDGSPSKGAVISLKNEGGLVMPVLARVIEEDGDTSAIRLPVEVWQRGEDWTFKHDSDAPIKSFTLDPDTLMPDVNRTNNKWPR